MVTRLEVTPSKYKKSIAGLIRKIREKRLKNGRKQKRISSKRQL